MTINFQIGIKSFSNYNFNENDNIKLKVIKKYNLNVNYRGKNIYTLLFLYKINNQIINKQIKIKDNSQETIDNCITQLEKKYEIVKNIIEVSVLEVSQMREKELSYFCYIPPNETLYEPVDLPIDPYYVGFWLGDGHSSSPGMFTCGGETENGGCNDQEFILPFMKEFALSLNLEFKQVKDGKKKCITFSINDGNKREQRINSKNVCFEEDWLEDAIKCCKALEISKKTLSPYDNFRNNYDPCKEYLNGDNYNCKSCNYKTTTIKKRNDTSLIKTKQYVMKEHLKNHNINLNTVNEVWNKLTDEEKLKWKTGIDKKDICKNSKYFNCSPELTRIYKIYVNQGINGLNKYREEKIKNCNQLNYWFRKLNLIGNKHIPE